MDKLNPLYWRRLFLLLMVAALLLVGCSPAGGASLALSAGTPLPPPRVAVENTSPTATPSSTPPPTLAPTDTPPPALTPTTAPTLHPMSIIALRQADYPGSEITIERELERGANYRRYYASYLSQGLRIYALLTIPDAEIPPGGWPAIVFNHGYIPPDVYRTTERYIAYVDHLARSGFVVFRIDYRGHDRSEGQATGAYGNPGYTHDVLNAVTSLKNSPSVNPEKIGMWGHSMGGFLTLRAMVISPDIKAGVIWAGVVASYPDLLERWRRPGASAAPTPPPGVRRWRNWINDYGSPEQNPDFWREVSSNSFVDEISGPVQLHHGAADESVPLVFSELLAGELEVAGMPVELYTYPGDNHNISNSFSVAMTRTIEFFNTYLKD
ncbi:MAG TPA: alpha/beta fold hydrolase [Levilinea sp.]|nr:alpha/beta fold hydrolase [Levilinea sp.]